MAKDVVVEVPVSEDTESVEIRAVEGRIMSHFVVHVELHRPINKGDYKRSYIRVNSYSREPEINDGVMWIDGIGMPRFFVPMDNVVAGKITYVWVPEFDGDYLPNTDYMAAGEMVGHYVKRGTQLRDGDGPKAEELLASLDESSQIHQFEL
jgi:hypothetical protein